MSEKKLNILLLSFNLQDDVFPLGLAYLKSYAAKFHPDLSFVVKEFTVSSRAGYETNKNAQLAALSYIEMSKPDLVAFSCYIWSYNMARDFAVAIKKISPATKVLLGGVEVDSSSLSFAIDYVICGEGELAFKELLDHLKGDLDISLVHNLISSAGVGPKTEISSLNEIPFPYLDTSFGKKFGVLRLETSRGCTFSCKFCHYAQAKLRYFSLDYVLKGISFLFANYNFKYLTFLDANFNADKTRMFAILDHIESLISNVAKNVSVHIELRPELIDEEICSKLSKYSYVINCELGFQSSDQEVLKAANRPTNIEAVKSALGLLNKYHIRYKIDLMYGLPKDNFYKFLNSIRFLLTHAKLQKQIVAHHYMQLNNTSFSSHSKIVRLSPGSSSMVIQTDSQTVSDLYLTKLFLKQLNEELKLVR